MSAPAGRVGRFYTAARRHPWVLGKVADWKIPLGPYTPAQITLAVGGGFLLVKTAGWWSWMGPVPIVAWLLAIWTVRRPTVRGRAPVKVLWGWLLLAWQPRGGRIGGRAARDRAPRPLLGGFTIEEAPGPRPASRPRAVQGAGPAPAAGRPFRRRRAQPATPAGPPARGPVSGVQQLRALAGRGGGVR
ncbi:hypothetical protein J8N05_18820 [Streptomyces sp. BH-SS-21]|uniref:Uncharacterized protein n=1 Tax=Streptomyces liliiviolaceus TaxID=2823109 RepID=A0A940XTD0_9ACTN|nr:hypothetical protein [Streptomyces liliiviolaceus]MBQ0850247.1 hypothetical protein [Streptomyces liliiviolaceus]